MGPSAARRLALAAAFARAARLYWLHVFPRVRRDLRRWHRRALEIPDPVLRQLALETQRKERGNLEGAAAFATFVPQHERTNVMRAVVAFQATYDYVDTLAEQPADDPAANGRLLHQALEVALTPGAPHPDYYVHHRRSDDGGYLNDMVDVCRSAFESLPSHRVVQPLAHQAVTRMVEYQTRIHAGPAQAEGSLQEWAHRETPRGSGLLWWETAAAGASSLLVFALIAAASKPSLDEMQAAQLASVYFPWAGALHVLLDSLIDLADDAAAEHHSLIRHYKTSEETADRMAVIARQALQHTVALHDAGQQAILIAGMSSYYLASSSALPPHASAAAARIAIALGDLATPTLAVLRLRRGASRIASMSAMVSRRG